MPHFPKQLCNLPKFAGPFDAFKLEAKNCDVLFASYPAGTTIPPHEHETENVGVITQGELILSLAGNEINVEGRRWASRSRVVTTPACRYVLSWAPERMATSCV